MTGYPEVGGIPSGFVDLRRYQLLLSKELKLQLGR
jgi:hypothetical protein